MERRGEVSFGRVAKPGVGGITMEGYLLLGTGSFVREDTLAGVEGLRVLLPDEVPDADIAGEDERVVTPRPGD